MAERQIRPHTYCHRTINAKLHPVAACHMRQLRVGFT